MEQYVIKYLIGGYTSLGRVQETFEDGNSAEEVLAKFWKRYSDLLYCCRPVILGFYSRKTGDTRAMWEARRIPLDSHQTHGYNYLDPI